jgi:protocatechuate 3,4-dioxygenase beta subunit
MEMTRYLKGFTALILAAALAACGGGGGSAGSTGTGTGGTTTGSSTAGGVNTSTSGGTQTSTAGAISLDILNSSNVSTTQVGATEQGHAVATVTDPNGAPVGGVIVVFSQADATLLTLAPASGTALTDANGHATIDFKATDATQTGAVSVVAQVLVGSTTLTATKGVQVSGSAAVTAVPTSMLFLDASPTSIVIKGAGGSGRSETSTLRFKVTDANNTPVQGAIVNFAVSNNNVTLNIPQSTSDAEGVVVTTVTSGATPTSVVVTATAAANGSATVPSSTLSVSNGLTVAGGLEVVAEEHNLDGSFTGATTNVSAFMRDVNGNLVPDGTIASFTTDFGAVGSSSAGSCASVNGTCSVQFRVQNPRGNGVATVTGTVQLPGQATPLADSVQINMANSASARALFALPGSVATIVTLSGTCKDTFTLFAADNVNRALAAGTTIAALAPGKGVTATVDSGTPVQDQLDGGFTPSSFRLTVDATSAAPACNPNGTGTATTSMELKFTSPNNISSTVPLTIAYPI